jgi:hypothetical protein
VAVLLMVGDSVNVADTVCTRIVLGLSGLGKVPTAWSGMPLAVNTRALPLQRHAEVLVALTDGERLKLLALKAHNTPAVDGFAVDEAVVGWAGVTRSEGLTQAAARAVHAARAVR